jgi:hypothetical protein
MGNRRYTLDQKIRFFDTYEKMESVAGVARAMQRTEGYPSEISSRQSKHSSSSTIQGNQKNDLDSFLPLSSGSGIRKGPT